ncbi:MAG: membrane protein insertion efficiency factor YidD [Halothece sp.]
MVLVKGFEFGLNSLAVLAIQGYQKYISPHKGFCCAHRKLYGGNSCSQYVKNMIIQEGIWNAIPLSRQRFKDCRSANNILKSQRDSSRFGKNKKQKRKHRQQDSSSQCDMVYCDLPGELCDFGLEAIACEPECGDMGCLSDCSGLDCTVGACDCGW